MITLQILNTTKWEFASAFFSNLPNLLAFQWSGNLMVCFHCPIWIWIPIPIPTANQMGSIVQCSTFSTAQICIWIQISIPNDCCTHLCPSTGVGIGIGIRNYLFSSLIQVPHGNVAFMSLQKNSNQGCHDYKFYQLTSWIYFLVPDKKDMIQCMYH